MLAQLKFIFVSGVIFTIAEYIKTRDKESLKKPVTSIEAFYLVLQVLVLVPAIFSFKMILAKFFALFGIVHIELIRNPHIATEVFLLIFFGDFFSYWLHRLFHLRPFWYFHSVHHSIRKIRWATAQLAHPLDPIITFGVLYYLIYLFNFSIESVIYTQSFAFLYGLLCHSKIDINFGILDYIFISPKAHLMHHRTGYSGSNKNFSSFIALWDIIFGTFEKPNKEKLEFGITNLELTSLKDQIIYPFKKMLRKN